MRENFRRCLELLRSGYVPKWNDGYPVYDERIRVFIEAVHSDEICDHNYLEHSDCIRDKAPEELTHRELCTFFTYIVRGERFCSGHIAGYIQNGILQELLECYLRLTATGREAISSGILGMAVADALGVPAEFKRREELHAHPITDMIGGGAHQQVAGTWSDDTSMALCLAFSLADKGCVDADDIMRRFGDWYENGTYSPHGQCFDVGTTVQSALKHYAEGIPATKCGGAEVRDNGNGSLMRILPLVYFLMRRYGCDLCDHDEAMRLIDTVSSLTHRHPISKVACGIYVDSASRLLLGNATGVAVQRGVEETLAWYADRDEYASGLSCWKRLLDTAAFAALPEAEIRSSGYVVDTLEAALWCLLNTDNYRDCILKAVNLGEDTDTVAAVAGGLAGIRYGLSGIPAAWLDGLQNMQMLEECCERLATITK